MAMIEELQKEIDEWNKEKLVINGYPDFMHPQVQGIPIDMLQLHVSIIWLGELIRDHLDITEEEFDVQFQKRFALFLKNVREANIERVKKERNMGPQLAVAQSKLLGPDGNLISQ